MRPATSAVVALSGAFLFLPCEGRADERDAIIQDLQKRVEALEQRLKEKDAAAPAPRRDAPEPRGAPPLDEESRQALERTLTRQGGLVLPAGTFELEPRIEYSYRGTDALTLASVNGQIQ